MTFTHTPNSQSPLETVKKAKPLFWLNPHKREQKDWSHFPVGLKEMQEAATLWQRFSPFLKQAFPETEAFDGIPESPLKKIPQMQKVLEKTHEETGGRLFLKCDHQLPVIGSIKARGGFFEVLTYAEKLALREGLLQPGQDYHCFSTQKFKDFFAGYTIGVASTGNLGLSIGVMGTALGFSVKVYMSHDAKAWKKDLLRRRGAQVIEYPGDFSKAIVKGRSELSKIPQSHFVDDEDSLALFLGYTVGALELARQLETQNIKVDEAHPLFVYSPCGVGGSPGGTAFGLKQIYGDHVHCFFAEPTHSPAVLAGLLTQKMNRISVQDIGLDGITEADGLAVARPSRLATKISNELISGIYTLNDDTLFKLLAQLYDTERIFLEPSATIGLPGYLLLAQTAYAQQHRLHMQQATHIAWATGGNLVPETERKSFYKRGKSLMD